MVLDICLRTGYSKLRETPPNKNASRGSISIIPKDMEWILKSGGIEAIEKKNIEKAKLLYNEIDNNDAFYGFVEKSDRSIMNVTFGTSNDYSFEKFDRLCSNNNINGVKGHRSVGGFRVSLYNAISIDSVKILIEIMQKFNKDG